MPSLNPVRRVPWLMALQAAMVARDHWGELEVHERQRLQRILRDSRGRPGNVSAADRDELKRIVRKLDLVRAGREVALGRARRGRRKRR